MRSPSHQEKRALLPDDAGDYYEKWLDADRLTHGTAAAEAFLPHGVVRAAREFLVLGERARLVVAEIRLVHRGRHDVVGAAGDEQERGAVVVGVIHPRLLVARREVREHAAPDPGAGRRDVV